MKTRPFACAAALLLASCAGSFVEHTDIATGATNPRSIYIRPFDVSQAEFTGRHGDSVGEKPLRRSLAPAEFAEALKEEMEKLGPAVVLKDDEVPPRTSGWLVTGYFEEVHAGSPILRAALPSPNPFGRSHVRIHVQIIELGHHRRIASKNAKLVSDTLERRGDVIYEFDVEGGSRASGHLGSMTAPGLGYATPFDYRNAADRIVHAITPDPHQYGIRHTSMIR